VGARAAGLALVGFLLAARLASADDAAGVHTRLGLDLSAEGRYREALAEFERAYALDPTHPVLRRNLANAYANLGGHLLATRAFAEAKEAFRTALDVGGEEPSFYTGLGAAALGLGETGEALVALQAASRMAQGRPEVLVLLGEVYQQAGDAARALEMWEEALRQRPEDRRLRERVERAVRAARVEERYEVRESHHFRLAAGGEVPRALQDEVLTALEQAYQTVGFALGYYPTVQVPVVLHPGGDFAAVAELPHWVGGAFDALDGRIRIPVRGLHPGAARLREVLFHEYTHVVIAHLTRGRVPRWLNEGLAVHFEGGGPSAEAAARRLAASRPVPLASLQGTLAQLQDPAAVAAAYAASATATALLVERVGLQEVGRLLRHLGAGVPWERAFEEAARMDLAAFEQEWQQRLRQ
jgi:tetratricopeptide (TPR) repeat protein